MADTGLSLAVMRTGYVQPFGLPLFSISVAHTNTLLNKRRAVLVLTDDFFQRLLDGTNALS